MNSREGVKRLHAAGYTPRRMQGELGLSKGAIYRWHRILNLNPHRFTFGAPDDRTQESRDMADQITSNDKHVKQCPTAWAHGIKPPYTARRNK